MTPTIAELERMTAEDVDTEVRRYLNGKGAGPTTMQQRAKLVTQLRERKLWPAFYRKR
jgi:hypothetical protein